MFCCGSKALHLTFTVFLAETIFRFNENGGYRTNVRRLPHKSPMFCKPVNTLCVGSVINDLVDFIVFLE